MTTEWWILLLGQIITVLGLGGVLVWMDKTINAMKGTVHAQKETIDTLRTILEAADVPKMAERFKSYRELVDHEKEADAKNLAAQFEQDKQALALNSQAIVKQTEAVTGALFNFAISALPFVPKADRRQFIELKVDAPGSAGTFLRGSLQSYAEKAPDLSGLQSPLAVSALRLLASQDVLQVKLGEQSTILPPRV